ncbi:CLUMA_CG005776, isoform A [Clunio marinus]|uniref:CLUMA_CG005776, isoform A n=1 Tax=Clunio marinus TaxID=568069 RepID=A0A1J1HW71_9DIPT|nr:CLUMA_CG005776, isoform A [Clunio marinus]
MKIVNFFKILWSQILIQNSILKFLVLIESSKRIKSHETFFHNYIFILENKEIFQQEKRKEKVQLELSNVHHLEHAKGLRHIVLSQNSFYTSTHFSCLSNSSSNRFSMRIRHKLKENLQHFENQQEKNKLDQNLILFY